MSELDEKMPWESKTELIAFVGIAAGLIASFGLIDVPLSIEQITGIGTILFALIAIARKYGGGKIVLKK